MPQNLTKNTIKCPKKIAEKAKKKSKKAQNFKITKKTRIFWVIQFRIVQNELWYTWAFFFY